MGLLADHLADALIEPEVLIIGAGLVETLFGFSFSLPGFFRAGVGLLQRSIHIAGVGSSFA